jgi:hypothetical protein
MLPIRPIGNVVDAFIVFLAQYYQDKNEMGYMYVMEHVKTVISNSGSVLFLDNTSDASRATGINQTNSRKQTMNGSPPVLRGAIVG